MYLTPRNKNRIYISVSHLVLIGILVLVPVATHLRAIALKVGCARFTTQSEAQKHYSKILDRDGDGLACEQLPK